MKKEIICLLLVLGFCSIYVNAQDESLKTLKPTWGLKTEINMSNFFVSGMSGVDSKMKVGGTFGGFINLELTKHFALQGELLYHYKTSELNRQGLKGKFQYWGMEIPIYAMYYWKFDGNRKAYIGLGPYAEFGFSAELKRGGEKIDLYEKDNSTSVSSMQDSNSGFGFIAGYEFACGLQINAGYKVSVTDVLDANSSSFTLLPNTISFGVGYHFR